MTSTPDLEAWDAWTPAEAAACLDGAGVPWCVVAGWAIELFLGEPTREHSDLEIEVLRDDFPRLRDHLTELAFYVAGSGEVHPLAPDATPPPEYHQNWGCDLEHQVWRIDVMLESGDADMWRCRRGDGITAPRSRIIGRSADGIPYLQPEAVLLYKAKAARPKDEADLAACLPRLTDDAKAWLRDALAIAHPDHPWLRKISGD